MAELNQDVAGPFRERLLPAAFGDEGLRAAARGGEVDDLHVVLEIALNELPPSPLRALGRVFAHGGIANDRNAQRLRTRIPAVGAREHFGSSLLRRSFGGELLCHRVAPAYVERLAVEVRARKFLESQRLARLAGYLPAGGQDVWTHRAAKKGDVAHGEPHGLNAGEPALLHIWRGCELAVDENVAGAARRVARLDDVAVMHRAQLAALEARRPVAPHVIDVAFDKAAGHINPPV